MKFSESQFSNNKREKLLEYQHYAANFDFMQLKMRRNYSRHVFLVTPLQAAAHTASMTRILEVGIIDKPEDAQKLAKDHAVHDVQREFTAADIDSAEAGYKQGGKPKKSMKPKKPRK